MFLPHSTYRIQFHQDFTFQAASRIVDYLHRLGIHTLYASPIFKAAAGSNHGYDVADPNQINPEVGTMDELQALSDHLRERNMGWLQDIVPNHMVFSSENALLMDVLEKGYASAYSRHFDISWNTPNRAIRRKLLVPFLGAPYHEALYNGEIKLEYAEGTLSVVYYQLRLPLRIESYVFLFGGNSVMPHGESETTTQLVHTFVQIAGTRGEARTTTIEEAKRALWQAYSEQPDFRTMIEQRLEALNDSKEKLHLLLSEQYFRLSYWQLANKEINYRRFFNINELISIRVEDPAVLEQTHGLIFDLLQRQIINGVRIDHVDGLNDPLTYLQLLRQRMPEAYIVVEKILETGEVLPTHWPVQGTSGYDFLTYLNSVCCDTQHGDRFGRLYAEFIGEEIDFDQLLFEKKRAILRGLFVGDLEKLFHRFRKMAFYLPEGVDMVQADLRQALTMLLSCFPVYRTYTNSETVSAQDRVYIEEALEKAAKILSEPANNPTANPLSLPLQFLRKILLLEFPEGLNSLKRANWLRAVMHFQQITSPLMAKGLEDTAFYIFNRLVSLNEVGGNPDVFGITAEEFHRFNQEQQTHWPHKLNALATHDTKRGEDVRARINVLSELPDEWETYLRAWHAINQPLTTEIDGKPAPDANEEYLIYQTLLGAWPIEEPLPENFAERIEAYLLKAMREAKVHTDWLAPNEPYEQAVRSFFRKLLDPSHGFLNFFLTFQKKIAYYGMFNSLSQTLLKLTSPGVPDTYQGCELWDLSLVDPDNRRPVDYDLRMRYLEEIQAAETASLLPELLLHKEDGRIKLFITHKTLQMRNQLPDVFTEGAYLPLLVTGEQARQVIAFARVKENRASLVIAPRFYTKLAPENELPIGDIWDDTAIHLPETIRVFTWTNVFTGKSVEASEKLLLRNLLADFPLGLFHS